MSPKDAFISFLRSTAAAAVALFAVLLLLERLVPSSVSPFVDLADLAWIAMIGVVVFAATTSHEATKLSKVALSILTMIATAVGCLLLWRIADGFGTIYLVFCSSILLTTTLVMYAIVTSN